MNDSYTPIAYEYREVISEQIAKGTQGKIFFFNAEGKVDDAEGKVINIDEITGKGMFITLDNRIQIRIDRIITLFGKPGAAYDEYDAFANACLDCTGGYPL